MKQYCYRSEHQAGFEQNRRILLHCIKHKLSESFELYDKDGEFEGYGCVKCFRHLPVKKEYESKVI